jgi:hypothetical protein
MKRLVLSGWLAAAVALASCGGSSNTTQEATTPAPTATTTTTTSASVNPARRAQDQATATRGVFKLSDFPPGWRTDSVDHSPPPCGVVDGLQQTASGAAAFTQATANGDNVDSRLRVFGSVRDAHEAMNRLRSGSLRSCYADLTKKRIEGIKEVKSGQIKVGDVKIGALSAERYGQESAALQIVVPLLQGSDETDLYSDSVFVRVGRAVLVGNFTTQVADFDANLISRLLRAATSRLASE